MWTVTIAISRKASACDLLLSPYDPHPVLGRRATAPLTRQRRRPELVAWPLAFRSASKLTFPERILSRRRALTARTSACLTRERALLPRSGPAALERPGRGRTFTRKATMKKVPVGDDLTINATSGSHYHQTSNAWRRRVPGATMRTTPPHQAVRRSSFGCRTNSSPCLGPCQALSDYDTLLTTCRRAERAWFDLGL